jgi:hypothetical protein
MRLATISTRLDLRLSRSFVLRERWGLSLIGDVIDQFHASRGFVLELTVVVILVIELAYLFRGKISTGRH